MLLTLLGLVQVHWQEGSPPRFRSQRTMALLGYLVAEARPFSRDYLAALFWPDEEPAKGKANLRRELHNLAQILPGCWQTSRVEVAFVPSAGTDVDVIQFQQYEATGQWQAAADLIGGDFLEGISLAENLEFETWLLGEQERWRQRCTAVLHRLLTRKTERGQYRRAIKDGRHLLQLAPWHEETHRQVMLLLAWTGERAEAIKQFESCRQLLADHLEVGPEEATQTLYQHILEAGDEAELKQYLAATYPQFKPPHNLPQPVTSFIGRSEALQTVQALLSRPEVRLLTLTGPGGTGKTRLALEVAHLVLDNFQHGAFFIDLAPLTDPDQIAAKIAGELQIVLNTESPILDQLKSYLRDKQLLLLLDNIEHLLPATPQVGSLLAAAPDLMVFVTSRVLLRLSGEWDFPVQPLALPDLAERPLPQAINRYDAVRLFEERAKAVKPDFALAPENGTAVAEICIRLDGLPLAIELVAARSRLLSPTQILTQWNQGIHLHSRGARDLPDRQQTLQATLDWSYSLLKAEEQSLLGQLAVFVGGFTLDAAEIVCSLPDNASILTRVESLLDNSLLRESRQRDEQRFLMLVTIREYGINLLRNSGAEQEIRQRHAQYSMALAETARSFYNSNQQVYWLNKVESEQDNVRAALAWSYENELEIYLRLATALGKFWLTRGYLQEGNDWLRQGLRHDDIINYPHLRARALYWTGRLAYFQSNYQAARADLSQSVNLWRKLDDKKGLAPALCYLGVILQDNLSTAHTYLEESIGLCTQIEDNRTLVDALFWYGHIAYLHKDYSTAQASAQRCMQLALKIEDMNTFSGAISILGRIAFQQRRFKEADKYFEDCKHLFSHDVIGMVIILSIQGEVAYVQKAYERAILYYKEILEIAREVNDQISWAYYNYMLGMSLLQQNDLEMARHYFTKSLRQYHQFGSEQNVIRSLMGLAAVTQAEHQPARAAKLIGTIEAFLENVKLTLEEFFVKEYLYEPMGAVVRTEYLHTVAATQASLTPDHFSELWAQGRNQSIEQVLLQLNEEVSLH